MISLKPAAVREFTALPVKNTLTIKNIQDNYSVEYLQFLVHMRSYLLSFKEGLEKSTYPTRDEISKFYLLLYEIVSVDYVNNILTNGKESIIFNLGVISKTVFKEHLGLKEGNHAKANLIFDRQTGYAAKHKINKLIHHLISELDVLIKQFKPEEVKALERYASHLEFKYFFLDRIGIESKPEITPYNPLQEKVEMPETFQVAKRAPEDNTPTEGVIFHEEVDADEAYAKRYKEEFGIPRRANK